MTNILTFYYLLKKSKVAISVTKDAIEA